MSDLLVIEVSPLGEHSVSRSISKEFLTAFTEKYPQASIVTKDLAANPIPHLDAEALRARHTPETDRSPAMQAKLDYRLGLANELKEAKQILVSTPMWNWSLPSVLKAYFDQVFIPGLLDGASPETSISGKVTIIASQGGSYAVGAPLEGWDHLTGYVKQYFTAIGGKDIEVILSEFGFAGIVPAMAAFVDNKAASICYS
ncbi:MAG: NAD(P)H-dependent oxidoreductase [Actinomycetota bacterium]